MKHHTCISKGTLLEGRLNERGCIITQFKPQQSQSQRFTDAASVTDISQVYHSAYTNVAEWAQGAPEIEWSPLHPLQASLVTQTQDQNHRAVQFCTDFLHEAPSVPSSHHPPDQPGNRELSAHYPGPPVFSPRIFCTTFSCLCQPNADLLCGQLYKDYTLVEKINNSERKISQHFSDFITASILCKYVLAFEILLIACRFISSISPVCLLVIFLLGFSLSLSLFLSLNVIFTFCLSDKKQISHLLPMLGRMRRHRSRVQCL